MRRWLAVGIAAMALACVVSNAAGKDWETDFGKASAKAKAAGKYLLVDFSGSDWCGWCIKLDREVFSKPEFRKWADGNVVCVIVDFPRLKQLSKKEKEANDALKDKYGIQGFPTVLLLSPEGELAGRTGYQPGGPKPYIENLAKMIEAHQAARPKASATVPKAASAGPRAPDTAAP